MIILGLISYIYFNRPKVQGAYSEDTIINGLNAIRKENKLKLLSENSILDKTATIKACDMRDNNYWSHKDLKGNMSWNMIYSQGYKYHYVGENLAKNCSGNYCINLWMNSPSHRAIILKTVYDEIGIGRCGIYTVIHLGSD